MAIIKKRTFERDYVQIPNETAQAPQVKINKMINENAIPLESSGLLLNLWCYDYEKFELHKTELYKRFAYNKETSVKRAWKFLMDTGYIIEFKYRDGKKWEYVYIFNVIPYTDEQKAIILEESRLEYGDIRGLENEDLNSKTSKCGPQTPEISNTISKQYEIKAKQTKTKDKELVNKGLENLPEKNSKTKEELNPSTENFDWRSQTAKMQKEFNEHLANKRKEHQENPKSDYDYSEPYGNFLINVANEFYTKFAVSRWSKKQWNGLINRLSTEIIRDSELEIYNHRGYLYRCLENIAYKHDLKYGKVAPREVNDDLPFYDWWLEE